MVQGTSSSVGKSVIAAAFCRILAQNGVSVAPFKAQNMSNNSYVTADGGEMGRAQVVQAQAAGVEPHTDMNPVLLKPEADSRSQVVINGKPVGSFEARKYWGDQSEVWTAVTEAYDRLAAQYDVIVLEGAGSPAEVNLRDRDIVNMRMAAYANAAVVLVGDIDRGGVFASLLGTMELLLPDERKLVKATLINRFRGDIALLDPLPEMIAEKTGVPVMGIVPFIYDLQIKDEDGVTFGNYDPPASSVVLPPSSFSLREKVRLRGNANPANTDPTANLSLREARHERRGNQQPKQNDTAIQPTPTLPSNPANTQPLTIAVIALPRVSNHDDLDPFRRAGCRIRIVTNPQELLTAQIVIIPGSKSTIADLRWMKSRGLDTAITEAANRGVTIVGICGGYQILGQQLDDPEATESGEPQSEAGLGLLPITTVFNTEKTTRRVSIEIPTFETGPLKGPTATGRGYEIHTGQTTSTESPLAILTTQPNTISRAESSEPRDPVGSHPVSSSFSLGEKVRLRGNASVRAEHVFESPEHTDTSTTWPDGTVARNLPVFGSYVHGLFDSPEILTRLLHTTAETHNLPKPLIQPFSMEDEFDRLAATVRESIDPTLLNNLTT